MPRLGHQLYRVRQLPVRVKFGVQFNYGQDSGVTGFPGGALYFDYAGEPDFARFRDG